MRNNNNGIILFQLQRQILNLHCRNRVQRTGRLVHEDNLRLHSQGTCNAQALLLSTAKAQRTLIQSVFKLVPDGSLTQTALYNLVQLALFRHAMDTRTVSNVIINAFREGVRLLKDHTNAMTQADGVNLRKNILAIQCNAAFNTHALFQVVHSVQCFQKGGFAAAGRADKCGNFLFLDIKIYFFQRLEFAVIQIQILH